MERALRLLLVEDDPDDALLVRSALRSFPSVAFAHADSLATAVAAVATEPPDVVLLDLHLREVRGLDTVDRAVGLFPDVPILALTSLQDDAVAIEAVRRGAEDYLLKDGVDGRTIVRACSHALARRRLRQSGRDRSVAAQPTPAADAPHVTPHVRGHQDGDDHYRSLVLQHPDAVLHLDHDGGIVDANVAAQLLLRRDVGELLACRVTDVLDEADRPVLGGWLHDVRAATARTGEVRLATGTLVEATVVPILRHDEVAGSFAILHDVSQRQEARLERQLLAATFEHLAEGILLLDEQTLVHRDANQAACDLIGVPREQLVGRRPEEVLPNASDDRVRRLIGKHLGDRSSARFVTEVRRPDGSRVVVDVLLQRMQLPGAGTSLAILLRDRGDLDRAEREHQQLQSLVATTDLVIATLDPAGVVQSWNPGATRVLGVPRGSAIGRRLEDLVPLLGGDTEVVDEPTTSTVAPTRMVQRQTPLGPRTLSETRSALVDRDGGWIGTSIVGRDLTSQETMRAEMQQTVERFAELAGYANLFAFQLDPAGPCFTEIGDAVERVLGYTPAELLGAPDVLRLVHPEDAPVLARWATWTEPQTIRVQALDGGWRWLETTLAPVADQDVGGLLAGFARDVTERHHAEVELQHYAEDLRVTNDQLQRAASFRDDLLAVVSHELRTPLTPIMGFTSLLQERYGERLGPDGLGLLEVVDRNAGRLLTLVDELLMASRATAGALEVAPEVVPVRVHLERYLADVAAEVAHLHLDVDGDPHARVDPRHLERMVANLLTNAQRYGRPPYELVVRTDGPEVLISVADHGDGVPATFVEHLFEPFHQASTGSTRTGAGFGLGLWIVRLLARANGGDVTYRPSVHGGAGFEIRLPVGAVSEGLDPPSPLPAVADAPRLASTRRAVQEAVLEGDLPLATATVADVLRLGSSVRDVVDHVVTPILRTMGEGWAAGRVDVATEHRVTTQLTHLTAWLQVRAGGPTTSRPRADVVAVIPDDLHELPARLAALWLSDAGVRVRMLGRLTAEHVLPEIERERPHAVLLTVTDPAALPAAAEVAATVLERHLPVLMGGAGATVRAGAAMGATVVSDLPTALSRLDAIVAGEQVGPTSAPAWPDLPRLGVDARHGLVAWLDALPEGARRSLRPEVDRIATVVAVADTLGDDELLARERTHLVERLRLRGHDPTHAVRLLAMVRAALLDLDRTATGRPTATSSARRGWGR